MTFESSLLLTSGMDKTHAIVDVERKIVCQTFNDHSKYVTRVHWSPSGNQFVSASYDGTIGIYWLVDFFVIPRRYLYLLLVNIISPLGSNQWRCLLWKH